MSANIFLRFRERVFWLFLFAGILYLLILGITWGLPGSERLDLVLTRAEQRPATFESMASAHADLFTDSESIIATKSVSASTGAVPVMVSPGVFAYDSGNNKTLFLSLSRSYILRTFEPDATNILNAFARVDPAHFDFFPNTFQYGIVFIILFGAIIKLLALLHVFVLSGDLSFYLRNSFELGVLYLGLRWICFYVVAVSAIIVYLINRVFFNKRLSAGAALLFLLMPSTLISIMEVKPHQLGCLFFLGMFYFCVRSMSKQGSSKDLIGASICAGLAYGTVITNIVFIMPLCVAGVMHTRERKIKVLSKAAMRVWGRVLAPCTFIALIMSIYIFIYPDVFKEEINKAEHFYGISSGTLFISSFFRFFAVLSEYAGLPIVLCSVAGTFLWKRMRLFLAVCYGVLFILFVKFGQSGPPVRFILPVLPLMIISALFSVELVFKKKGFIAATALFLVLLLYPAVLTIAESLNFNYDASQQATRLEAGRWINKNIPDNATIGLCSLPTSFETPPFQFTRYRLAIASDLRDIARADSVADFIVDTDIDGRGSCLTREPLPIELVQEFKHQAWLYRLLPKKRLYGIANPPIRIYKVIRTT
jgi:hypothetical protein